MKKVKFIKNGSKVGLAYNEGQEVELKDNLADELADAKIVKIIPEKKTTPEEVTKETKPTAKKNKK